MKPAPRDPKQILLVRTDCLGETVLNVPLVAALKAAFPRARVTWLVNPALVELLRAAPADEVLACPQVPGPWWWRAWRLSRLLRRGRFDLVLISNATKESHLASWLAGMPVRAGYDRKWGFLLTHRIQDRRVLGECHEVEYNMRLLSTLGLAVPSSPTLHLPVTDEAARDIAQRLRAAGLTSQEALVVVHPWTANLRKQWPLDRVRGMIARLSALPQARVLVVGGPEERLHAHGLVQGMGPGVTSLVGELLLPALAACLRRARVVVSNDSGPMHLAAAVGTPVVALFGTQDPGSCPERWGPWGSGHTVIHKPLDQISIEEVVASAQRYLS